MGADSSCTSIGDPLLEEWLVANGRRYSRWLGRFRRCSTFTVDFEGYVKRPNQSPEPTVMSVTPRADARVAPSTTVAHL
jgi:hypothetical protein